MCEVALNVTKTRSSWFTLPEADDAARRKQEYQGLPKPTSEIVSRTWKTETYVVTEIWKNRIIDWAEMIPTIAAFASPGNNRFKEYWTKRDDAFLQDWSRDVLWINPAFSMMEKVLRKILTDQARGILVIPIWTRYVWFPLME